MSFTAPEPIDKKDLLAAATEMQHELTQLAEERRRNRRPRPWHRYTDRVGAWMDHRRALRQANGGALITRRWVPYVLLASLAAIWTPDSYKIKLLYAIDAYHEHFKFRVHCWYWRQTMEPAKYALLMEQIEANMPKEKREKSPDCPL